MTPCFAVEFTTPKGVSLRGLWFGSKKPLRTIVWVHGLGGSAFSMRDLVRAIADSKTAVLTFSNRGHDQISYVSKRNGTKKTRIRGGAAHEEFSACVDDIDGAISFVRKQGVRSVYLAGHSTGCQKSVYWAYKKGTGVNGIILLAPISDWAGEMKTQGKTRISQATTAAKKLIAAKKPHSLLPEGVWHETLDAQRFLSLYSPDSVEEIFSYAQPKKNPRILHSLKIPTLVLLAEKDEFADRSAREIGDWFEKHLKNRHRVSIIPDAMHGFAGTEKLTARTIQAFI